MTRKPRARDLGLPFPGQTGTCNAITDVAGVEVGFCTLTDPAKGLRTGVTAILPRGKGRDAVPVLAGHFALNGNGEMTGTHWIDDAGHFLGPVMITNTHAVGACHTAAVRWMIDSYADHFRTHAWAMPVVAETYDGVLNDILTLAVTPEHGAEALAEARPGPVAEGSTGGGNGMIAYEFKGGTGTSSRVITAGGQSYTIAALVQANYGIRPWLNILGAPIGQMMPEGRLLDRESGSIIVIIATDAPLSPVTLRGVAKRAGLGIGRSGTVGGDSSGDIFLAFSTANARPAGQPGLRQMTELDPSWLDPVYEGAVQSVDEAVINALVAGEDVPTVRPAGQVCRAIDTARLAEIFAQRKAAV